MNEGRVAFCTSALFWMGGKFKSISFWLGWVVKRGIASIDCNLDEGTYIWMDDGEGERWCDAGRQTRRAELRGKDEGDTLYTDEES